MLALLMDQIALIFFLIAGLCTPVFSISRFLQTDRELHQQFTLKKAHPLLSDVKLAPDIVGGHEYILKGRILGKFLWGL